MSLLSSIGKELNSTLSFWTKKGKSLNNICQTAKDIYQKAFGSDIAEIKSAIKEDRKTVKEATNALKNDDLTKSQKAVLTQIKENAEARIKYLTDAIKEAKILSVRAAIIHEAKTLCVKGSVSDDKKAKFVKAAMESNGAAIAEAKPEEIAASAKEIAAMNSDLKEIIDTVKDDGIRTALTAEYNAHVDVLAKQVADKIGPSEDTENAKIFFSTLATLNIKNNLTETVREYLTAVRIEQNQADETVAQKNLDAKLLRDKKDEKVKETKISDRKLRLKNIQSQLHLAKLSGDAKKAGKLEAQVRDNISGKALV
jgi:hypothetical protein